MKQMAGNNDGMLCCTAGFGSSPDSLLQGQLAAVACGAAQTSVQPEDHAETESNLVFRATFSSAAAAATVCQSAAAQAFDRRHDSGSK